MKKLILITMFLAACGKDSDQLAVAEDLGLQCERQENTMEKICWNGKCKLIETENYLCVDSGGVECTASKHVNTEFGKTDCQGLDWATLENP